MNKIFLLLTLGLMGCTQGKSSLLSENIIESDWAQRPKPYKPKPLFCYRSIGKPECYSQKMDDAEQRFIASYPEDQLSFDINQTQNDE